MAKKFRVHWSRSLIVFLCCSALLVVIDFVTKWLVQSFIEAGDANAIEVIPHFFYLNKSYNTAVAFSLGSSWGIGGRILNIAISLIMSVAIYGYWLTHHHKWRFWERFVAMLLGAGAVGNLIDRAFYWEGTTGFNGVIDFMQFFLGGGTPTNNDHSFFNPFATFNFADACLTVGIVILLVLIIVDTIGNRGGSLSKDPRLENKPAPVAKEEEAPKEGEE